MVCYKGEGSVVQFTMLSSWEIIMGEICERWALDASQVSVKFITPDSHGMIYRIELDENFQTMCLI